VGSAPTDVAVAGGYVWVADSAAGEVTRIDPVTRRADRTVRLARGQVLALAAGNGALWVVKTDSELSYPLELLRLDPRSGAAQGPALRVPGAIPVRLAVGAGSVWLTDVGNTLPPHPVRGPGVIRVDPRRLAIVGSPVAVGGEPAGIAVGAGGVWVSSSSAGTVSRLGPIAAPR
jgi:streptogramin lyase